MITTTAVLSSSLTVASIGDYVARMDAHTMPILFKVVGISKSEWGGYLMVECVEDGRETYDLGETECVDDFLDPITQRTKNGSPIGWLYLGKEIPADFI